jgi:hypothetical protein
LPPLLARHHIERVSASSITLVRYALEDLQRAYMLAQGNLPAKLTALALLQGAQTSLNEAITLSIEELKQQIEAKK